MVTEVGAAAEADNTASSSVDVVKLVIVERLHSSVCKGTLVEDMKGTTLLLMASENKAIKIKIKNYFTDSNTKFVIIVIVAHEWTNTNKHRDS